MKHTVWNRVLFFGLSLIFGAAAAVLMGRAMVIGYDRRGLFVWTTPEAMLAVAVAVVYAVVLGILTRTRIRPSAQYEQLFPRGWFRGSLMALGGAILALDLYYALEPSASQLAALPPALARMEQMVKLLGYVAAGCMAVCGVYVILGSRPRSVFHGIVCVYAVADLLLCYRSWGASAHLEQYAFSMLSSILLMLYSFHRCAADAGVIRRRQLVLTGFGAVFCSLAALGDPTDKIFYLAVIFWIFGSMCAVDDPEK